MDMLALQWSLPSPDDALAVIEKETGRDGFLAYLAFVSEGVAAHYSPLGILGRGEPGLTVTIIVSVVELGLTMLAATVAMLWRTRAVSPPKFYVPIDDAAFDGFRRALQRLDWAGAGAALAESSGPVRHAVIIEESSGAARIEAFAVDAGGTLRASEERRMVGEVQAKQLSDGYLAAKTRGPT